jgi:hypothetical protein
VEKPKDLPPICACCRSRIDSVWQVTQPAAFVICGSAGCTGWARAQGLRFAFTGVIGVVVPKRPRVRVKPRCEGCGGELPRPRDQFRHEGLRLCTLTCLQAVQKRDDLVIARNRRKEAHARSRS